MNRRIVSWGLASSSLLLAAGSAHTLLAESPARVRQSDMIEAQRILRPAIGFDEKLSVPPGTYASGNGVIEPADRETRVASEVSGRVAKVFVQDGRHVEPGDPLIELDRSVQHAALAAANANVEAAVAELTRTRNGERSEDVEAADAEVESARARATLSAGVAQRLEQALAGGGATRDEAERARHQATSEAAQARLAEARLRAAFAGSRSEDVAAARARWVAAVARRDLARAEYEQRLVCAPIAGEILQVKVRAGEFFQAGGSDPLVVLGDTRSLRARIDIDERDVGTLELGASAVLRISALPGVDFPGTVTELGRRMGRKNVRTDDPVERNDTKILEAIVTLEPGARLIVGERVTAYLAKARSGS